MRKRVYCLLVAFNFVMSFIIGYIQFPDRAAASTLPSAANVTVFATVYRTDGVLIPSYTYNGGTEGNSVFKWLQADSPEAPDDRWEVIADNGNTHRAMPSAVKQATAANGYLILSQGQSNKYIKFEITPVDSTGTSGTPVRSPATSMIEFTPNLANNGRFGESANSSENSIAGWKAMDSSKPVAYSAEDASGGGLAGSISCNFKGAQGSAFAVMPLPSQLEPNTRYRGDASFKLIPTNTANETATNAKLVFKPNTTVTNSNLYQKAFENIVINTQTWTSASGEFISASLCDTNAFMGLYVGGGPVSGQQPSFLADNIVVKKIAPWVRNIGISADGGTTVGETLTGTYVYINADDKLSTESNPPAERASAYRWLKGDQKWGPWAPIEGQTGKSLSLTPDLSGKYIRFEVTPKNSANPSRAGKALTSTAEVLVKAADEIQTSFSGPLTPGAQLNGQVTYKNNNGAKDIIVVATLCRVENGIPEMKDIAYQTKNIGSNQTAAFNPGFILPPVLDNYIAQILVLQGNNLSNPVPVTDAASLNTGNTGMAEPNAANSEADTKVTVHTYVKMGTGIVEATGAVPVSQRRKVMLLVLKPSITIEQITPENVRQSIGYMGQKNSTDSGKYGFIFNLGSFEESQNYHVIVGSERISEDKQGKAAFMCFGPLTITALVDALKDADTSQVEKMLNGEILINGTVRMVDLLQLDMSGYRLLESHQTVLSALAGKDFSTGGAVAIEQVFYKAVEDRKKYEEEERARLEEQRKIDEAVNAVKNANTDTMAGELEKNNGILQLDLTNPYGYGLSLGSDDAKAFKDTIHEALIGKSTLNDIRQTFRKIVALSGVNNAPWDMMEQVLNGNNAILGLNLTGDYSKLSNSYRIALHKAISLGEFNGQQTVDTNLAGVKTFFDGKVQELTAQQNRENSTGSSGRSGGSTAITMDYALLQPTLTPDINFIDIDDAAWAKESIQSLALRGYIVGFPDNTFRPDANITRGEFITLLIKAFQITDASAVSTFSDAVAGEWYYPYIASAQKYGIVKGNEDGTFGIGRVISREEMVVMAYRVAVYANIALPVLEEEKQFADVQDISTFAGESIKIMQQADIVHGTDQDRFSPKETSARAMAAKVIFELLKYRK